MKLHPPSDQTSRLIAEARVRRDNVERCCAALQDAVRESARLTEEATRLLASSSQDPQHEPTRAARHADQRSSSTGTASATLSSASASSTGAAEPRFGTTYETMPEAIHSPQPTHAIAP